MSRPIQRFANRCGFPRAWRHAARLTGLPVLLLWLACSAQANNTQCCSSIAPEMPPATTYGSTMYRNDDPRSNYQPYQPIPLDASAPPEILLQRLWLTEGQLGVYSSELVPALQNLGAAYFADGDYVDAIDTYGRAIHLLRVNEGLNTNAQTGMVEQVIEAHLQMGNYIGADGQHDYLYRIRKKNLSPTDPEMVAAVEQYADWHRAAYLSQLDKVRYPRIVELFDLYVEMADAVEEAQGGPDRAMMPYLEGKLRTEYMLSVYPGEKEEGLQFESGQQDRGAGLADLKRMRFMAFEADNYRNGLKTITAMGDVLEADESSSVEDFANLKVKRGDWYQWHRRYALAIRAYEEAWSLMADQPSGADWLAGTFEVPLELPSQVIFQPGRMPLRLYNAAEVKARFQVSRHGEAQGIEILSPGAEENQPAITLGIRYLRDMRFRPRLQDGEVVASGAMERIYNIRY